MMRRAFTAGLIVCCMLASACEEAGCSLQCDEEEDDCRDNPMAYALLESCDPSNSACAERICDGVYDRCKAGCSEPAGADASF